MNLKDIPESQRNEVLFTNLVLSLSNAAMMALGRMVNPVTNKEERDLEMAEMNIEMLAMLQARTRNNLTDKEDTLLTVTLTNLRLAYVEELNKSSGDSS
jgi:hypothetical protein